MWTREQIIRLLKDNPRAVERGIVRIYQRQTADEQATQSTRHANGKGFNATDARMGCRIARWVLSNKPLRGIWLERARQMCIRYSRQLVEIANKDKYEFIRCS